jgi:hypothetical protein
MTAPGNVPLGDPVYLGGGNWGYALPTWEDAAMFPVRARYERKIIPLADGSFWIDERSIPHRLRPWRPFVETEPLQPDGSPGADVVDGFLAFYANSHYLVFVASPGGGDTRHLSMRTVENDTRHDWREMQRVKTEILGPEWEGVELYPAEDRVVDTANQYHLWCFPWRIPLGWQTGIRSGADEAAQAGATQRSFS